VAGLPGGSDAGRCAPRRDWDRAAGHRKVVKRVVGSALRGVSFDEGLFYFAKFLVQVAQNLLLAAHAKGLYAAWKTGKMVHSTEVKKFLGFDPSDRIIAVIYLGAESKEEPGSRERRGPGTVNWLDESALTV